jgi:hypothetical protein
MAQYFSPCGPCQPQFAPCYSYSPCLPCMPCMPCQQPQPQLQVQAPVQPPAPEVVEEVVKAEIPDSIHKKEYIPFARKVLDEEEVEVEEQVPVQKTVTVY